MSFSNSTRSLLDKSESCYVIVEFPDEAIGNNIPMMIISSTWIFTKEKNLYCYWPSLKSQATLEIRVKEHAPVDKSKCVECPIVVKYASTSYEKAFKKMRDLEHQSSVSQTEIESDEEDKEIRSTENTKRVRTKNHLLDEFECSSLSSEEDAVPKPPKMKALINKHITSKFQASSASKVPISSSVTPTTSGVLSVHHQCKCGIIEKKVNNLIEICEKIKDGHDYLIRVIQERETNTVELLENPVLKPSATMEELENLNQTLDNPDQLSIMSASLQTVGGKDVADTTRRILGRLLMNRLAVHMNWTGRNEKFNFSSLKNVVKLILVAVRKNPLSNCATQDEVESIIKLWLRNAADRDGGRSLRIKTKK